MIAHSNIVINNMLNSLAYDTEDIVLESPPGGGKTTAQANAVAVNCHLGRSSIVCATSNAQANAMAEKIARSYPGMQVTRLTKTKALPDPRLTRLTNVRQVDAIRTPADIVVTTNSKLAEATTVPKADVLFIEEAHQTSFADFQTIRDCGRRAMLTGDAGQIPPICKIDVRPWAGAPDAPYLSAPTVVLARNEARLLQFPVSWRLPADTAQFVAPAFYPTLPFVGHGTAASRQLRLRNGNASADDALLDDALSRGSLSMIMLPGSYAPSSDIALIEQIVRLTQRLLARRPAFVDDSDEGYLSAPDIGIVAARVDQVTALQQALRKALGAIASDITVDTLNRVQGAEFKVVLALHPLSGVVNPSAFDFEPGRYCVALSRHRIHCIVFSRAGVGDQLEHYMVDEPIYLGASEDPSFIGWRAHSTLWHQLNASNRIVSAQQY